MVKDAEDVVVTFTGCDVGWVYFAICRGEQNAEIRASEVFDPFPDLIAWLEAIAVEVKECAIKIDEEGRGKRSEYLSEGASVSSFEGTRLSDIRAGSSRTG